MIRQLFNRMTLAVALAFAAVMFYGAVHDPWAFAQNASNPTGGGGGGGGSPGGVTTDIQCNVSSAFNACATTKAQVSSAGIGYFLAGEGGTNSLVIGGKDSGGISFLDSSGGLLIQNGDNSGYPTQLNIGTANLALTGYIGLSSSFIVGGTNLITTGVISGSPTGDLMTRVVYTATAGSPPGLSSCGGGSPAMLTGSTDMAGEATEGTSTTGCTLTMAKTSYGQKPTCVVTPQTESLVTAFNYTIGFSTGTVTIAVTNVSGSGLKFNYHCDYFS